MKLTCPACGALFSLDTLLGNEGAREAVMAAMRLPAPLGGAAIRYIALFRPAKRNIALDRVANLLNELLPMIEAARIERNGRSHSAPLDYWQQAMTSMVDNRDKLGLPLKSHGYLLSIIEGYNLKAEQRQEQAHEDRLAGRTPTGGQRASPSSPTLPPPTGEGSKPRSPMPQAVKDILKKGDIDHATG